MNNGFSKKKSENVLRQGIMLKHHFYKTLVQTTQGSGVVERGSSDSSF